MIPGKGGEQPRQQIDFSKTTEVKCESCSNPTFKHSLLIRKLSALAAPDGQETIVPVAVFSCEKCGHVNADFTNLNAVG